MPVNVISLLNSLKRFPELLAQFSKKFPVKLPSAIPTTQKMHRSANLEKEMLMTFFYYSTVIYKKKKRKRNKQILITQSSVTSYYSSHNPSWPTSAHTYHHRTCSYSFLYLCIFSSSVFSLWFGCLCMICQSHWYACLAFLFY